MVFIVNERHDEKIEDSLVFVNDNHRRIYCKDKECEPPYGGKDDCELRDNDFCRVD